MKTDELIRNVRYTMKKHANDRVGFGDTDIYLMCRDILPALEQLARYQEAEKATNEYLERIAVTEQEMIEVEIKDDIYIVIKREDAMHGLDKPNRDALARILHTLMEYRLHIGKQPANKYYVCNQDEPYAAAIRDTILRGEAVKLKGE